MSLSKRLISVWSRLRGSTPPESVGTMDTSAAAEQGPASVAEAAPEFDAEALCSLLGSEHPAAQPDPVAFHTDEVEPPDPFVLASRDEMLADVLERAGAGVGLSGLFDDIGVEQLITMIRDNQRSGRLFVRTAGELLDFELFGGRIARVQVTGPVIPGERLGEILVSLAFVEQGAIDECLALTEGDSVPLGVALVDSGVVSREDLTEAVGVQTVARMLRAMEAGSGAYAFRRSTFDLEGPPAGVDVDPFTLLEDVEHLADDPVK